MQHNHKYMKDLSNFNKINNNYIQILGNLIQKIRIQKNKKQSNCKVKRINMAKYNKISIIVSCN